MGLSARKRVLRAARTLFAKRGYHNTTVREIAAHAHTNLASINYYFHSKDELYREVLSQSFREIISVEHADIAAGDECADRERLRSFIHQLVAGRESEDGFSEHLRLLAWEMLSPTSALDHIEEIEARRHLDRTKEIVRPLLPEGISEEKLEAAALALIGQCLIFRGLPERIRPVPQEGDKTLSDLIFALFLNGLESTPG